METFAIRVGRAVNIQGKCASIHRPVKNIGHVLSEREKRDRAGKEPKETGRLKSPGGCTGEPDDQLK